MEIIYLYIKKFKSLKSQNINFGSEHRFEYDEKTNELKTIKNELYIQNFYNINNLGARVLNVSSIIGKNGTGKSTILEFIKRNFSSGLNLQEEMILVVKENDKYKIISTIDLKYDNDLFKNNIELFKKKESKKEEDFFFDFGFELRGLNNTDIIYFSNIFDGVPGGSVGGLYDISTNCLIFEDYNSRINQGTISKTANPVGIHLIEDIFRQLKFLTNEISKDKIKFKLPEELIISINQDYLLFNQDKNKDDVFKEEYQKFKNVILSDYFQSESDINQSVKLFICYVLLNLVKELLQLNIPDENLKIIIKYNHKFHLSSESIPLTNLKFDNCISDFFEEITRQIKDNNILDAPFINELINKNKLFVDYIFKNKEYFINNYFNEKEPKFYIEVKNKKIIDDFLTLYLKTYSVNSYLNFNWRSISSGERALLNIYSRFFSLSNNQKFAQKLSKNLIILIDEGDVYLHPSWQKKFLKNILEYLPVIFDTDERGKKRNMQIIFTTNSPIPASDLLNYNTIFLDKNLVDSNGNYEYSVTIKDSLNDQKETFAANIHTLLSDSFFVKNGLVGEFAVEIINKIIGQLINKVDLSHDEQEKIRKIIHQIGEPVLKRKLMQMYDDRFNLYIHERLDKIEKKLGI